jgi:AraC-like DNA-binding protein
MNGPEAEALLCSLGDALMNRDVHKGSAASDYREFRPPSSLAAHVLCVWTQSIVGTRESYAHRVLPDACIDIVLIGEGPPVVVGPWTESFVTRFAPGTTVVGARFYPGQASALLGVPASDLLNQSVPLRAMWEGAASAPFARVAGERSLASRRSAMEAALLDRLAKGAPVDLAMRSATCWIGRHPQGRMEELSHLMGISNRQLQRRFVSAVGYGPKLFQSVLRFQRLLNLSGGWDIPRNLAEFAAEAGYADQAHMTREVQRFSGVTPSVLLRSVECSLRFSDLVPRNFDRDS